MPWPRGKHLTPEHKAKVAERQREYWAANPERSRERAEKQKATWDALRRKRQANNLAETQARICRKFERNRMKALAAWLHSEENAEKLARLRQSPGFEEKRLRAHRAKCPPLPPMSIEERRLYKKLRKHGIDRGGALEVIVRP